MRKLVSVLGLSLGLAAGAAQAALITEVFQVTLQTGNFLYDAGHVFQITATYDNAGTEYHIWNDGPDGKADFGTDDDTLAATYTVNAMFSVMSDAQLAISGLSLPAGWTTRDVYSSNVALYRYRPDASLHQLGLAADGIELDLYLSDTGTDYFSLEQFVSDPSGQRFYFLTTVGNVEITRTVATVPEPASLALLGLGIAGFAASRRRKQ